MKRHLIILAALALCLGLRAESPWEHGGLRASADGTRLEHNDGTPFFWLADTGWLLPEKTTRDEAAGYLKAVADAGYNVVQVQTINGVPAVNAYGALSHPDGWNLEAVDIPGSYGYWDHMDYIIDKARENGVYIGMVCIWGGLVKGGRMDQQQAEAYGRFLADRYKDKPNIVWIIGGDIRGDVKPEVWKTLATTIRANDPYHLMTFHPRGRTSSAYWWNDEPWLDFNMFQSGHRRYDQATGDGDDSFGNFGEDNWRYVEDALARVPRKPVIDGEPSYEGIPQGLHDITQPLWQAADARRYAWWAVLAGAAGHTYGNNAIMQFHHPGELGAYGCRVNWYDALRDPGFNQMQHLKNLMLRLPANRVADPDIISGDKGERYERLIACRGDNYLLVYNYTGRDMDIDLARIPGNRKRVWWYDPKDGSIEYAGEFDNGVHNFMPPAGRGEGNDIALLAIDASSELSTTFQK